MRKIFERVRIFEETVSLLLPFDSYLSFNIRRVDKVILYTQGG